MWLRGCLRACSLLLFGATLPALGTAPEATRVPRELLVRALRAEQGYDRRATANQSRLQTRTLLRLAREAGTAAPLLLVDYADWFQAYLTALDLSAHEAPLSVRLSHEHQYDILIDARPGAVVAQAKPGEAPSQALNVLWRSRRKTPSYS